MHSNSAILKVESASRRFGGLMAVNQVNLTLASGEVRALIGPNGAGKTSLFNLVTGVLKCSAGGIKFKGQEISHLPAYKRYKLGIGRSFQIVNLFVDHTVKENVRLGAQAALKRTTHPLEWVGPRAIDRKTDEILDRYRWFKDPLAKAGTLIYAEQKKLETLMALTSSPDLLLLDEPAAGIDETDINIMVEMIRSLAKNRTVLLTDHDIGFVMAIADKISVLDQGSIIAEGSPREVASNPKVEEVYFGRSH